MKQRFELYIGSNRVDLGDENPVLFNYTVEELRNPSIMKNSYSQQLTLQGTAANNKVFQSYFRLDSAPGASFNPSKRVPFKLFADGGVVVESGYCKLDNVERTGRNVKYKLTLYGGLGGFLYTLQYTDEKTRSLADLLYTDGNGNPLTLDFTINRAAVMEAWANAYTEASKWSVINFAPCYEGIPDNFDAGRALVKAAEYGLETTAEAGAYTARRGFAVVDLPNDMSEWEVKDLRSYLQRPVISARAVIRAICNPANNGGYTVELDSGFFKLLNQHYYSAWLTLKRLTSLKLPVETHTYHSIVDTSLTILDYYSLDSTGEGRVSVGFTPKRITVPAAVAAGAVLSWYGYGRGTVQDRRAMRGLLVQAVGFDSEGNAIGGSKVVAFGPAGQPYANAAQFARACNDGVLPAPRYDDGSGESMFGEYYSGQWEADGQGAADWHGDNVTLSFDTRRISYVIVYADRVMYNSNYTGPWLQVFGAGDIDTPIDVGQLFLEGDMTYEYQTPSEVRSGAEITQAVLLSDTMSPAEFLLSYCKRYGLVIRVENDRKVVHIEMRSTQYNNTTVEDISAFVDRSRAISITPVPFSSEKMELKEDSIGAAYSEDYKARFGVDYGAKRINTGYEFNAEIKQLLSGSKFKSAPEVKARSLAFLTVTNPGQTPAYYPSVFLNSGLKYHLFSANNKDTNELVVPLIPTTVQYDYWDPDFKTYDDVPRLQLCDKDGKGKDGDGVLVFYQGRRYFPSGFDVSDDEPEMYLANKDKPCWILEGGSRSDRILAPCYGRFRYSDSRHTQIADIIEFSTPAEIDIPGATILPNMDVYAVFWARYIADRYNPSTKVLTCYVEAGRIPDFGPASLRRFFWIDGAVWVLNKIDDYNLNGDGITKCEFVQVQDVANYNTQPNI